eukprot:scaffold54191_cov45-Attheya_sp.AAC.2
MKLFVLPFFSLFTAFVDARNVAISPNKVAVVAGGEGIAGLVSRQLPDGEENVFDLSFFGGRITAFDDVAIDSANPNLVFALDAQSQTVCSFLLNGDATLTAVSCALDFSVNPFCGISALNGTLAISGGTGGFTTFKYIIDVGNINIGRIDDEAVQRNVMVPNAIGYPDVLLVTPTLAAFSTDFADGSNEVPRFGTMMVDLSDESPQELYNFRVVDSLFFDFALVPSNFPLVNSVYETPCAGQTVMYTANGALTSQDPFTSGTTTEIPIPSFRAVTSAVNQEKKALFVGGVNTATGNSEIRDFTLTDPLNPLISTITALAGTGRVVSVASSGDIVLYIMDGPDGTSYDFFSHTGQTAPVQVCPTQAPTPLPMTPGPTRAPTPSSTNPTPLPTSAPTPVATPAPNDGLSSSTIPTPLPTSAPTESPTDRSVNSGIGRRGTLLAVSVLASLALMIV